MKAHVIENGVVVNTIVVDSLSYSSNLVSAENGGEIGDLWDGSVFTRPEIQPSVPISVTRFQALAALDDAGHLDEIDAIMSNLSTPKIQRLAYQNALNFERNSLTVAAMAAALNLSDEDVDQLFIDAAGITA